MKALLFKFTMISLVYFSTSSSFAESLRTEDNFGAMFTVNDPIPGKYGLKLGFNAWDFVRFETGGGIESNAGDGIASEIGTNMTTAMFWIMTLGLIDWEEIHDFVSDDDQAVIKTVFSWSLGATFLVPEWSLSPAVGIHYGGFEATNGALDLPDSDNHVFYKIGVDWQSPIGFQIGAGWSIAPELPQALKNKAYINFGYFF